MREKLKTYRSKNQVVIGWVFVVLGFFFAIGYLQDSMELGIRILWGLWVAYWLYFGFRFIRAGIRTSERGVHVVNMLTSFDLRWEEIREFQVGRWKLLPYVCRIELRDGSTKPALGIQERTNFPSVSAERMAEELNEELRANARSGRLRTTSPAAPW